jgi:hypothetical protein
MKAKKTKTNVVGNMIVILNQVPQKEKHIWGYMLMSTLVSHSTGTCTLIVLADKWYQLNSLIKRSIHLSDTIGKAAGICSSQPP